MNKNLTRFLPTILNIFKIIIYAGGFAVFFLLMGIENFQLRSLSRTLVVMVITYLMLTYFLSRIYGGYDIGIRTQRLIFLSLELSMLMTDAVTYLMFLVMNTNDANNREFQVSSFGFFCLSLVLQSLIIFLCTKAGGRIYDAVRHEERVLIIGPGDGSGEEAARAVASWSRNFTVTDKCRYDVPDIHERIKSVDSVFFYDVPQECKGELINYCYKHLRNVYLSPDISDIVGMTATQMMFGDVLFLAKRFNTMTFEQRFIKRGMDIVISLFCLILTSPLSLIAAIAIKSGDGGSILFKQKRATLNGRTFDIYKFRTMKENVENRSAVEGDERITKAGVWLRKYRLDEIPQFINIIKGDMSLVGPRPEMLENVSEYEKELPEFKYRLRMKAGLTGLAQIMGRYNTSSRDKLILDLMYIEDFSIMADIRILFRTVLVLFKAEDSTKGF